jgi:hypothetical protein
MSAGRFTIGFAAAIAALVVGVSSAAANAGPVDDYWRDNAAAASTSNTIVDDYWRDSPALESTTAVSNDRIVDDYWRDDASLASTSSTIVDDYFRDPPVAVTSPGERFDWGDFGIGIAVAIGSMLLLAGLATGLLALRHGRGTRPAKIA